MRTHLTMISLVGSSVVCTRLDFAAMHQTTRCYKPSKASLKRLARTVNTRVKSGDAIQSGRVSVWEDGWTWRN